MDEVKVWTFSLAGPDRKVRRWAVQLDEVEERRAAGFTDPAVRRRFVVSHGVTRHLLGMTVGVAPRSMRQVIGRNGKPYLAGYPELSFSLSHSGDLAALAVVRGRQVGVDVEGVPPAFDAVAFAARFFPEAPAGKFGTLWTRKEACVKASGGRMLRGLRLPVAGASPLTAFGPVDGELTGPWVVQDLELPPGYAGAVALTGSQPFRVVYRSMSPRMNASTASRAWSSLYCSGGDFMK
jgi:4'-phosphopantetheinyl transferase